MDPSNYGQSELYQHPEDLEPEDKPSTQKSHQPLAKSPFAKPSGTVSADYYNRPRKSFTPDDDSGMQYQGPDEEEEDVIEGQGSEGEGTEEGNDDIDAEGEEVSDSEQGGTIEETLDKPMPCDQDVNTQAKPGEEEVPTHDKSKEEIAQDTSGKPRPNQPTPGQSESCQLTPRQSTPK